jgi:hypothetical protein
MPVSRLAVICKAGQLKPAFKEKTLSAHQMCVSRFLLKNNLVQRVAPHTAQRPPKQVTKDAKGYLRLVVPKCVGRTCDQQFMYNMDQTNTYFAHAPKTTINERGARTINMHVGANDSKRCTVAFTITAPGDIIKPMVIYAGTRGGRIATNKLPQHHQICTTQCRRRHGLMR